MELNAPNSTTELGEFDAAISLKNMSDLYGASVRIEFDPSKLEVIDANETEEGIQLNPGSMLNGILVKNEADNVNGVISFAVAQLGDVQGVEGNGVLATVRFKAKEGSEGTTELRPLASNIQLLNSENADLEFQTQPASISIAKGQTVSGQVGVPSYQGLASDKLDGFTVRLLSGQQVVGSAATGSNGNYTMSVPASGDYLLTVNKDGYLRAGKQIAINGDQAQLPNMTLLVGDFTQDGAIDIVDITHIAKQFEKSVAAANGVYDVNKDQKIDMADIVPVAKHFGKVAWDRIDQ
ncbi:cohesin domain-containing protein [Ammoniphilus sp. CFH 90114]|uniref:cohesin domain-containing protein n=1 Tax=Ammoniphilus sp. CFH 90114 TaxID=2493665 RepID=UPI0021037642|nr:cohesin domain-containing protein [Ammoniphilus sp. CFH 90114]